MHRIERTPFNEYESVCQEHSVEVAEDPSERMEREADALLAVLAWVLIMAGCIWLLHELIHMAKHYESWKWMVQQ